MTCPTCIALRFAWYATATQIRTLNVRAEIVARVIAADRKRKDYIEALEAYREHKKTCPVGLPFFDVASE